MLCVKGNKTVQVEWQIKEFYDIPEENGYWLRSPFFWLSDTEWYIKIYPNGEHISEAGSIALYLYKKPSPPVLHVSYTIGLKKADGTMFASFHDKDYFGNECYGWGTAEIILKSDLFLLKDIVTPDGVLTVCCTAYVVGGAGVEVASQTSSSGSVEVLQQHYKNLFLSKRHSDMTIKIQDQEFQVHRLILTTRSSVFSAMFDHDTAEKQSGIVHITDCSPESFKDFLFFLYTGEMDLKCSSNAVSLYRTADKYDVEDLKQKCVQSMVSELSAELFCDVILLATVYNESQLLETATNFFIKNAANVILTSQWQSFVHEHSTLVNELLIRIANKCDK